VQSILDNSDKGKSMNWVRILAACLAFFTTVLTANAVVLVPTFSDVNCDGNTDILDVQLSIISALGFPVNELIDANGDGIPDTCDVFASSISGDCQTGQIIRWDGTLWTCSDDDTSGEISAVEDQIVMLTDLVESLQLQVNALASSQNSGDNDVAPYEPWNPSILLSPLHFEAKAYWVSFHAPSNGFYTNATIKTSSGPYEQNIQFVGTISVGIYTNKATSPPHAISPYTGYSVQNMPSEKLGDSTHNYSIKTDVRGNIEFEFEEPIYLEKNQMYWFALSQKNQFDSLEWFYLDFHADHHLFNGTVLEQKVLGVDGLLPEAVANLNELNFSERAFWFRIFGTAP
jgi:hypothetical protein